MPDRKTRPDVEAVARVAWQSGYLSGHHDTVEGVFIGCDSPDEVEQECVDDAIQEAHALRAEGEVKW